MFQPCYTQAFVTKASWRLSPGLPVTRYAAA